MESKVIDIKINNYIWQVIFTDREGFINANLPEYCDGITKYNEFCIYIDKDVDLRAQKEILIHELTHATLCVQGRWGQKKFTQEEVCEFVGFCAENIIKLADEVIRKLLTEE